MTTLSGRSACPGLAFGQALVVRDVSNPPRQPPPHEYVLVIPFATPLLYPLVLGATALVAESGGIASHAASLARELGIPCVVQVEGLLDQITTGQGVRVDGTGGHVVTVD